MQFLFQDALGELPRRHQRKIAPERQDQHGINARGFEQAQFLRQRSKQLQSGVGAQDARRMRLECHRNRFGFALPRPPHDLAQHMRVRPVHSVKITHAHQRRPESRRNVIEFVKDLHGSDQ